MSSGTQSCMGVCLSWQPTAVTTITVLGRRNLWKGKLHRALRRRRKAWRRHPGYSLPAPRRAPALLT
ncbi:MAG: hypothetical protein BJ554DRAFT_1374 [Olpidium bornovanus]|uniref:Uncharacterized protein n=1 Tax=Olpidium bornovanus TaxID=278681 RepID=A0A8H7ZSJ9_9FUNG|nr:MAG: hypothetical protein BJ554DRAFT_1374 [Olpidium bornovanus]